MDLCKATIGGEFLHDVAEATDLVDDSVGRHNVSGAARATPLPGGGCEIHAAEVLGIPPKQAAIQR